MLRLIPAIPDWVELEVKRQRHDQEQAERELRLFLSRMRTQRRKTIETPVLRSQSERSPSKHKRQGSGDSNDSVMLQEMLMPGIMRESIRIKRRLPGLAR